MAAIDDRTWTCPDCGDDITLTLNLEALPPATVNGHTVAKAILKVDDVDVRAHLAMHELCTCGWEWGHEITAGGKAVRWTSRTPKAGCPIHRYIPTPTEGSNP